MCNILDLTIWQTARLEVDKMNFDARQREDELVDTCARAWEIRGRAQQMGPNLYKTATFYMNRLRRTINVRDQAGFAPLRFSRV